MRNKLFNKIISSVLVLSLLFMLPVYGSEVNEGEDNEFSDYEGSEETVDSGMSDDTEEDAVSEHNNGLILLDKKPATAVDKDISYIEALDSIVEGDAEIDSVPSTYYHASLPTRFPDTDDVLSYLDTHLTHTRNQNPYGSCWAFQTVALGEMYMINHYGAPITTDYSELHLMDRIYRNTDNPVVGNEAQGGRVTVYGNAGIPYVNLGGNAWSAERILAKGIGLADESVAPYTQEYFDKLNGETLSLEPFTSSIHLKHAMDIDITANPKLVKGAVMENGAVGIDLYGINGIGDPYYNNTYKSYCSPITVPNHAVCIVGWDDSFSKDNFNNACKPQNNGAWLIRNSWDAGGGTRFGKDTYYWLSYEEASIKGQTAYVLEFSDRTDEYDNNYYYDTQIYGISGYGNVDSIANVFKVQGKSGSEYEYIKEVQFSVYEANPGGSYEIDIYTDLKDTASPESGVLQSESVTRGKLYFDGIYTVELEKPVPVKKGSFFSICIRNDGHFFEIESELILAANHGASVVATVGKQRGQSFALINGVWTDIVDDPDLDSKCGNLCISVHTSDASYAPDTEAVKVKDRSGKDVLLIHNLVNNTYKTADGKDVLVLSFEKGSSAGTPTYEFTGKKLTPAKDSFVVLSGIIYEYKKDYSIRFSKNKNNGSAVASIKWKKSSDPYKAGIKKSKMTFTVAPRSVSDNMVSFSVKNDKLKKLRVNADGNSMKPKKKDFSYTRTGDLFNIVFKNNYKGTVNKKG